MPREGFVAGLRLVPKSVAYLARMRNVWVVMVVFAVLYAHGQMAFRWQGDRPQVSFGRMIAVTVSVRYQTEWSHPDYPGYLAVDLLRGLQQPLNAGLGIVQNEVIKVADRVFGPQSPGLSPRGLRLSFEILLASLLCAALSAGVLGWIKLSLQGKPLSISAFFRSVRKTAGPIWCWFLLLEAVKLLVTGLAPTLEHARATVTTLEAAALVILLPFSFLPFVVVAWETSIVSAFPASLRVFASRLTMLLSFLIVFRLVAEALTILAIALHRYGAWVVTSDIGRFAFPLSASLSAVAIALLLCTAFMLIVLGTAPVLPTELQSAEAAPA